MKSLIVFLLLISAVLAVAAFNNNPPTDTLPDLAITTVETRDVRKVVSIDGNLAGLNEQRVFFPSSSQVTLIDVEVGDFVKKNDLLAKVKISTVLGTQIKKIKAPIAGTIVAVNYSEDDFVSPTLPGIGIVNEKSYLVELPVNENDVVDLEPGQTATVIVPALSLDDEYDGKLISIDPSPISQTGAINYLTVVRPNKLPSEVKLGMSVIVEILAAEVKDVMAIPESFLIERGDNLYVKRLTFMDDERIEYEIKEVEVEIGLRTDEFVEIESGLSEGDELIEPSFTEDRGFSLFG